MVKHVEYYLLYGNPLLGLEKEMAVADCTQGISTMALKAVTESFYFA